MAKSKLKRKLSASPTRSNEKAKNVDAAPKVVLSEDEEEIDEGDLLGAIDDEGSSASENSAEEDSADSDDDEGGDSDDWETDSEDGSDQEEVSDAESSDEPSKDSTAASSKTSKLQNTKAKSADSKIVKKGKPSKQQQQPLTKKGSRGKTKMTQGVKAPEAETKVDDEYNSDTSDEEDLRNTVGKIPMQWYKDFPILGYDWDGKPIKKPERRDELDAFLKKMEDPDFWRTVQDPSTGQDVVLGEKDLILIQRLRQNKIPNAEHEEYEPWVDWFSSQVMQTALRKFPEHKRSFLPSRSEREKVSRMVHALKMGWREPRAVLEARREREKLEGPKFYQLWGTEDDQDKKRGIIDHIPAPKRTLPGHAESYNPPPEYLFTPQELEQWHNQHETPWKRKLHFIPQKFNSLRAVPAYSRFVRERFMRCLDLYMAPRARKNKLTIEPEDLLPELPDPKDLQPFPTAQSLVFKGHGDMVRAICPDPSGQFIASGSDDCSVRVWEVSTGRCLVTIAVGAPATSVAWNPSSHLALLAVAAGQRLLLCSPQVGDISKIASTDDLLSDPPQQDPTVIIPERVRTAVQWEQAEGAEWDAGLRVKLTHFKELRQVVWHGRGDYMAVVVPEGLNRSVLVHQVSRRRSQVPFNRARGLVQAVQFHPIRPLLFVATQRTIRVYDLVKQQLVKKLMSNSAWISSMAIHPGGDNLLVGCYDCKTLWFDLDLSTKPYLNLRLHSAAVRDVAFHRRYPLCVTAADDRSLIVCHARVYNDLLQNALVVPVKRLCYHEKKDDYGIFCAAFHPTQPWLFSGGADGTIRLYT